MITAEHWHNFDRLVAHLRQLPPEQFDYRLPRLVNGCGCVEAHAESLGLCDGLANFLGLTHEESYELWSPSGRQNILGVNTLFRTTPSQRVGARGIAEALRRLSVLESRYTRPNAPLLPMFQPDDTAFLQSVRALVGRPLVEVDA